MKLGGHMDYHGSRAYAPEPATATAGSWVKRLGGWLAAWSKQKLEPVVRPGAEQAAESIWLVHGNERHFSVLGSDRAVKRRGAAAPCPFPDSEALTRRPIGFPAVSEKFLDRGLADSAGLQRGRTRWRRFWKLARTSGGAEAPK